MDIEKLFLTRQSTRRYSEQPVSDEELERICRLGALAPSAKNSQPWKMFAINGEKAKDFACCVQMFGANKWASGCPAFIAIELKRGKLAEKIAEKFTFADFAGNDIGLLTAYITLAARIWAYRRAYWAYATKRRLPHLWASRKVRAFRSSSPWATPKRATPCAKRTGSPSTRYINLLNNAEKRRGRAAHE